jgi:hypothetical protein
MVNLHDERKYNFGIRIDMTLLGGRCRVPQVIGSDVQEKHGEGKPALSFRAQASECSELEPQHFKTEVLEMR